MVHTYLEWFKVAYSVDMELLGGIVKAEYYLSEVEVSKLRADFKSAMREAREYMSSCEHEKCSCVFSQEDIKRLVDLTKEPSYRLPIGLSREESHRWISDVGSKLLKEENEFDS